MRDEGRLVVSARMETAPQNETRFDTPRLLKARLAVGFLFFLNGGLFASWVARIPLIQQRLE